MYVFIRLSAYLPLRPIRDLTTSPYTYLDYYIVIKYVDECFKIVQSNIYCVFHQTV